MRRAIFFVALVVLGLTGYAAASANPGEGFGAGLWLVGLATGLYVWSPRARRPLVLVLVLVAGVAMILIGGRSPVAAGGYALAVAAEVWVTAALLRRGRDDRPALRSDADLQRWLLSIAGGVATGSVGVLLAAIVAGADAPVKLTLTVALAHVASQLCVTPYFLDLPRQVAIAGRGERVLQWLVIAVGTPLVFFPESAPSLVFLTIPVLAWGALRISPVESLGQMVAVVGLALVLTALGRGPFANATSGFGTTADAPGLLLAAFAVTCAVIVVPLTLRVGEYISAAREAGSERDLVRSIVDSASGVAIIVSDPAGRITLFNPGAERMLGYRAEEVLGNVTTMLHSEQAITDKAAEFGVADDFVTVVLEVVKQGRPGTHFRFRRKDGVERIHAVTISRLADAQGNAVGYLSTSEDVSDSLAAQRALRDALSAEREAVERQREVDAVKDAFVSTVSHELRTPITSMVGYLEVLSDGSLGGITDAQRNALERVSTNSQRLLRLIDELLTLSRVADQGVRVENLALDLRGPIREAVAAAAPGWAGRTLDVRQVLPDGPVVVVGDRDMLERVVVNLVSNAAKFTPDGGTVRIELTAGDEAVIRVIDTGIGVPVSEQAQLFSRFYRSTLAVGRGIPGSGLGLSITRAIVERHGGSISLASDLRVGTTVEVRLPLKGTVEVVDGS